MPRPHFSGGQQVPRLAGQREDYLLSALTRFRAGTRLGYTSAMTETLTGMGPEELVVANYLSQVPGKAP